MDLMLRLRRGIRGVKMQNELINGRTPEEIRKNIEGCSNGFGCDECPYEHETFERCGECIITDALAYIEHLEKKLEEAAKKLANEGKDE